MKHWLVAESKISVLTCIALEMVVDKRESLIDELRQAIMNLRAVQCPENGRVSIRTSGNDETTISISEDKNETKTPS